MIGVIRLGIAIEARMATSTGPLVNQTSRRLPRSVATAVYGIGRSSISAPSSISVILARTRSNRNAPGADRAGSSRRSRSRWVSPNTQSV